MFSVEIQCRKTFNNLLKSLTRISNWQISKISPIHKKGTKNDPDNYRGISFTPCLAKFFLTVLNRRLTTFAIQNQIFSKAQFEFNQGYRTSDALLILYNINYYCKKKKEKVFGCFVDFQKAFDSVPRSNLFQKLLDHNINGKFYDILTKLYTEDKACVKIGNNITDTFIINQGVKQGCILSPTLFNVFLSDLQNNLETPNCEPVEYVSNEVLGCLMWEDDLVLLSKSETGLQHMLDNLQSYTAENGLRINTLKTKIMIFDKSDRHMRRKFSFGQVISETTREYKYLGFLITPSGEVNTGIKDLKDRAHKAFMKLKSRLGDSFRKHLQISIKLFDSLIKPILLYGSDFWGILKLNQNNPIEILHRAFCKQLLGVQKQTTNIGVLLELGQIPLQIYAKKNAIKNWERISGKNCKNKILLKSYEFALNHNLTWPTAVKTNLTENGMLNYFLGEIDNRGFQVGANHKKYENIHLIYFQRMSDILHQNAFAQIVKETSKLRTYSQLKGSIGLEKYLLTHTNTDDRSQLTKIRLSNHPLMIVKGRHQSIEKQSRFCPFCENQVEDEIHFLLDCRALTHLRMELFSKINNETEDAISRNRTDKFKLLLSNENITHITARYISRALSPREFIMANHKNCL